MAAIRFILAAFYLRLLWQSGSVGTREWPATDGTRGNVTTTEPIDPRIKCSKCDQQ